MNDYFRINTGYYAPTGFTSDTSEEFDLYDLKARICPKIDIEEPIYVSGSTGWFTGEMRPAEHLSGCEISSRALLRFASYQKVGANGTGLLSPINTAKEKRLLNVDRWEWNGENYPIIEK